MDTLLETWPGLLFISALIAVCGAGACFVCYTVWREAVAYRRLTRKWKEEQQQRDQKRKERKETQERLPVVQYQGQKAIGRYFEVDEETGDLVFNDDFGSWITDFNRDGQRMAVFSHVHHSKKSFGNTAVIELRFLDHDSEMMFKLAWGGNL